MPNRDHLDAPPDVVDEVQHTVVADTNPVRVLAVELHGAGRTRCGAKAYDSFDDPIVRCAWKVAQLSFRRTLEQDLIRHQPRARRGRAARYAFKERAGSFRRCSTIAASIRSSLSRRSARSFSMTARRPAFG